MPRVFLLLLLFAPILDASAQEHLPFPDPPSESIAGPTLAKSKHRWRTQPRRLAPDAPNIVVFMTDDVGFGHPDTFGGAIHTPTLSQLAREGISFNTFHTAGIGAATRAALLTGRNPHRVGFGASPELAADWDGYAGSIPRSAATLPQVLRAYGYATAAFGKWHNTPLDAVGPTGPFDAWPLGLGFDAFYGFLAEATSQVAPRLYENTTPVEPPRDPGYHLTEDLATRAIAFIRGHRTHAPDRPFFLWFTPGAVHGPLQVQREWMEKYQGRFDEGWEKLRAVTFARQRQMGWIPEDTRNTLIDPTMQRWEDVPKEERELQTRLMEIYAGFLEHTDVQYGRIVDELAAQGLRENTIILYIVSDDGASAEGIAGTISAQLGRNAMESTIDRQIEVLDRDYGGVDALGGPRLDPMVHHGWAWAGSSPFKSTPPIAAHFGGTRTPMVISWPKRIEADSTPRPQFHHVSDIAPTLYDILDITPPRTFDGVDQLPLDGISMKYTFDDAAAAGRKKTQYFEALGSRGIYHEGWFAGAFGPLRPWSPDLSELAKWKPQKDVWELYHIEVDYSQADDLAERQPEKLAELQKIFDQQARENRVHPIGGGLHVVLHPGDQKASRATSWSLYPGYTRIAEARAPRFTSGRSSLAVIDARVPARASGVLFAVGGLSAGFTVYLDEGTLKAEYNAMALDRYRIESQKPIAAGEVRIEVETRFDSLAREAPATIRLRVDGEPVGEGRVLRSVPLAFTASETFDVGMDLGSPVSLDYEAKAPFPFEGEIRKIEIRYTDARTR